jgi:hypothetical protein
MGVGKQKKIPKKSLLNKMLRENNSPQLSVNIPSDLQYCYNSTRLVVEGGSI